MDGIPAGKPILCQESKATLNIYNKAKGKFTAVLFLAGLIAGFSCEVTPPTKGPERQRPPSTGPDAVSIFITGNVLGALKPCGCSGGQLGGLERRPAILNTIPRQKRLVMDTGSLTKNESEQELIKYNIIMQAMTILDYDLVNLTQDDLEKARNLGLVDNSPVSLISPNGTSGIKRLYQKQYLLDSESISILIGTFDPDESNIEQIRELFPARSGGQKSINLLIISRSDDAIISSISRTGLVDCIIRPTESDQPMVIGDRNRKPLVISVGQYGRYVCELKVRHTGTSGLGLSFRSIPVDEELPRDAAQVSLYKDYQQIVKDRGLLEKYPRFLLPNNLEYVGSKSCRPCHQSEYRIWRDTGHAKAYATLEQIGSQYDPECIVCHVVGMEYESGFVSEEQSSHLKNVDCENCHGPASEHIKTFGQAKFTEPKSTCIDCHTPEHSGEYAGNERLFLEKIIHWTEPNHPGNVK